MKYARLKFGALIVLVALALWALYPTYQLHFEMPGQERALQEELSLAQTRSDSARVQVKSGELANRKTGAHKRALHLGLDLVGGMHLVLEVDKSKLSADDARDAGDRALEVIRNRVDQFGVFEPVIQKAGRDRILIQLPGVDRDRAKSLIGQTAQLKFQLVLEERAAYDVLKTVDDRLKAVALGSDSAGGLADSVRVGGDSAREVLGDEAEEGSFLSYIQTVGSDFGVDESDMPEFRVLYERPRAEGRPHRPAGAARGAHRPATLRAQGRARDARLGNQGRAARPVSG